jgi:hypothetical protein
LLVEYARVASGSQILTKIMRWPGFPASKSSSFFTLSGDRLREVARSCASGPRKTSMKRAPSSAAVCIMLVSIRCEIANASHPIEIAIVAAAARTNLRVSEVAPEPILPDPQIIRFVYLRKARNAD